MWIIVELTIQQSVQLLIMPKFLKLDFTFISHF